MSKPILPIPKPNQNQYQNYQYHIKSNTPIPKLNQNQIVKTKSFGIGACLITKQINAVDVLVLSQGILSFTGRTPTQENIADKAALSYYGQVLFVEELLPLLRSSPYGGKVLFVMNCKKGSVRTPLGNSLPFYLRLPAKALNALGWGISPEDCAEFMINGILETEKGWRCIDEKGDIVPNKEVSNEEMLKKVWEHTCEITSRAV